MLAEWGLAQFTDAVTSVASQMITNSVTATGKVRWDAEVPPVKLWLLGRVGANGAGEVLVLVWDAVAVVPGRGEAGAEERMSRGGAGIVHWLSGGSGTGTCRPRRTAGRSSGRCSTARGVMRGRRRIAPAREGTRFGVVAALPRRAVRSFRGTRRIATIYSG